MIDHLRTVPAVALVALAAAALVGCSEDGPENDIVVTEGDTNSAAGSTDATPSSYCLETMSVAADELDPEKADPLIWASLSACHSADEWLAALAEYPAAMGLNERAVLGDIELQSACYEQEHRPTCVDAIEKGRVAG